MSGEVTVKPEEIASCKKPVQLALRPANIVMRLDRMGSSHPTRLSFLRIMLRRMRDENWQFDRPVWQMDDKGVGRAVYRAIGPQRTYSLVAFAHDIPQEQRSDRVIATMWDATFTLFDGVPTDEDLDRLQENVPLQEAGRITSSELSLSRANRSVRLFGHIVDALSKGKQPDLNEVDSVGYLMRTTAVYGSGKFGAADRTLIAERPELREPFQVEMLSVWLIREFTVDIVEHLAVVKGGANAVKLDREIKLRLGVGNSTGLGMAPFIVRHPALLNNWMKTRETALARVRALEQASKEQVVALNTAFEKAYDNVEKWHSQHPIQIGKLFDLRTDFLLILKRLANWPGDETFPWDSLWLWGEDNLSLEGQEALLSLLLEPNGDIVDELASSLSSDEASKFSINGNICVGEMKTIVKAYYGWALDIDFQAENNRARFWYVAEEKLEPRLGNRFKDEGAQLEQPLCIARFAKALYKALCQYDDNVSLAEFLLANQEQRFMVRRAQLAPNYPYCEVQDNLIDENMLPIDMMRCKLAFFGASRFDPRSDKWVRISLFQDMPYPSDMKDLQ